MQHAATPRSGGEEGGFEDAEGVCEELVRRGYVPRGAAEGGCSILFNVPDASLISMSCGLWHY